MKVSSRNSFLVVSKILRLFFNILRPDDKYSLSKSKCLTEPIQMQLSRNQKIFSEFFSAFPKYSLNLEYFEKEDDPQRLFFSEYIDCEKWGNLNG